MRVLIVSTTETIGGAAIAASRLTEVLNRSGVEARMFVRDKQSNRSTTLTVSSGSWLPQPLRRWWRMLPKAWERLVITAATGHKNWSIDIANAGFGITHTKAFREADIIHLHWVNQGMLSVEEIGRILASGKPVVWTLHDLWPVMAVHHYGDVAKEVALATEVSATQEHSPAGLTRLARRTWQRKQRAYARGHITFVGCSRWIAGEASRSPLTEGHTVESLPNTFPHTAFHPLPAGTDRTRLRQSLGLPADRPVILFGAQKATDERKGIAFLIQACQFLKDEHLALAIVGASSPELSSLPLPTYQLGYVSSETQMADIYRAADLFVTPSLEDNLPNTIMEAMACGTPCVGFRVGGIPEMIDHRQSGYVAAYRDPQSLADGIRWTLAHHGEASKAAAAKAVAEWGAKNIAGRFISLYEKAYGKP